jgi:thiamine-phosphate pyrophosphorylase
MADKPNCRLYLQVPAPLTAKLEAQLAQAMANTSAACVLLCHDDQRSDDVRADRIIDLVQAAGIACLIDNDIAMAERLGADGVHIAAAADLYAAARARLGESANIGVACGPNRDDAMRLAELGADYVAFAPESTDADAIDQCAEIIAWWSEIFVVPCIAWNVDDPEQAARFAALGADFVAPSKAIWQDYRAVQLIADIDSAIGRVRSAA